MLAAVLPVAHATEAIWTLPADLNTQGQTWSGDWRYQPGDVRAWSRPEFDDSSWPLGASSEVPLHWSDARWPGRGWFRLRIDAHQLAARTPLMLSVEQAGASEIYLDGERIATLGVVGSNLVEEHAVLHVRPPPLIELAPDRPHVLAVRYSNFYAQPLNHILAQSGGFTVRLTSYTEWSRSALANERRTYGTLMFFVAVPLLLAVIHLALFVFLPRTRENLYCALFMGALSLLTYTRLELDVVHTVTSYLLLHRLFLMAIVAFSLFSLLSLYTTFARVKGVWFYLLQCAGLALLVWPLFAESERSFRICAAFGFVTSLEAMRVSFLATRAGRDGAVLVFGGMVLFGLAVIYNVLRIFELVPAQTYSSDTMNVGILAAALGLSFFISRNYALTTVRLERKLREVEELSQRNLEHEREKQVFIAAQNERLELQVRDRTAELSAEKTKSDDLLANILPLEIAAELKEKGVSTPRRYEEVTILFSDLTGFTSTVAAIPAHRLIRELNELFREFDDIAGREGIEKIKTIGDAYMAAGGLPEPRPDHAQRCIRAALAMQNCIATRNIDSAIKWRMRVGLHSGPVVAGVVGKRKFTFDVFGDTVNLASRMETSAEPGEINLSAYTYDLVRADFLCDYRGKLDIKGKGSLDHYTVLGPIRSA